MMLFWRGFVLGAGKVIAGLVLLAIIAYGLYTILSPPPTTTFSGKYISFEYPKDWNITDHCFDTPNYDEHVCVVKHDEWKKIVSVDLHPKNVTLEDLKRDILGFAGYRITDEGTLGDVQYTEFWSDQVYQTIYVFEKDGRVLEITCDIDCENVAKDIIKSLRVKK